MSPEQVERLKREYTDKYVQLTGDRPDYARFRTAVGLVKTINMSGRALVEFADFQKDIGWYDIDLDFLKVVDKPASAVTEKAVEKSATKGEKSPAKTAPKTAASGKLSPLEMARQMGGSKSGSSPASTEPKKPVAKPTGSKLSPLEILRQQGAKRGDEAEAAVASPTYTASENAEPKAANVDGRKLSPIEILRQMGGAKGAPKAKESEAEEQTTPATDTNIIAKASEPIPPEATPAPLKWAREMESQRGPAKEAGYPTTADIYEMSQGKKPLGWRPIPPANDVKSQKSARVQGGRITSSHDSPVPLSTADIWAISRGERRIPVPMPNSEEAEESPIEPSPPEQQAPESGGKLSTADILAQLRAQGGGAS